MCRKPFYCIYSMFQFEDKFTQYIIIDVPIKQDELHIISCNVMQLLCMLTYCQQFVRIIRVYVIYLIIVCGRLY